MKSLIVLLAVILGSCTTAKITLDSNACNDTQAFIEVAKSMGGIFKKDGAGAIIALTLMSQTYDKCLQERKRLK